MAYSAPLSERIRIQIEIIGENIADCCGSISTLKRTMLVLCGIGGFLTLRAARKGVRTAKKSLYGTSGLDASYYGGLSKSSMLGGYGGSSLSSGGYGGTSLGTGGYGGTSTMYGGSSAGVMGTSSTYRSPVGGAGGAIGGSTGVGYGATGGGSTAKLADSHGTQIMTLDPSIHFYDYGSAPSFYGQIETTQAFDSPTFVSQVLNQPGQNKVLVIDGGGLGHGTGAVFDSSMAAAAVRNGWKGVIVHGLVRDAEQLSRAQLGVKALGTSPIKGKAAVGQKGMALQIGNAQIQPGWWVYADKDGVVMSQQDISGGSFGSGGGGMGGIGGLGASSSTNSMSAGSGGYGSTSTMGSGLGGSTIAAGLRGGYGGGLGGGLGSTAAGGSLAGGYGSSATGSTMGGGTMGGSYGSTTGSLAGGYGSSTGSLAGGYSSTQTTPTTGYGGLGSTSSSMYSGYGSKYGSYSAKKKKTKVIKLLLASAIAAIVWLLCLS